jgi:hypothetical protein
VAVTQLQQQQQHIFKPVALSTGVTQGHGLQASCMCTAVTLALCCLAWSVHQGAFCCHHASSSACLFKFLGCCNHIAIPQLNTFCACVAAPLLLLHISCRIVKHAEDHYTVTYKAPDGPEQSLEVGLVMMATGRSPRTAGLGLEVRRILLSARETASQHSSLVPCFLQQGCRVLGTSSANTSALLLLLLK